MSANAKTSKSGKAAPAAKVAARAEKKTTKPGAIDEFVVTFTADGRVRLPDGSFEHGQKLRVERVNPTTIQVVAVA